MLLKSTDELIYSGTFKFQQGHIEQINSQYFIFNYRYLMQVTQNIEYIQQVDAFAIKNEQKLVYTNNVLQYWKNTKLQWECKLLDLLPIDRLDRCLISKSLILIVHSSILFYGEDKSIQDIIQLEEEIHSAYSLNDFDVIGVFPIIYDQFQIYDRKLLNKYEFFSQKCVQFDVSVSFQPYRLSCFMDSSGIHLLLVRNLEHVKLFYRKMDCQDILSINKCKNRLIIIFAKQICVLIISAQENTQTEEQYLQNLQLKQIHYVSEILSRTYYFSNDDFLYTFLNDEVFYYKLINHEKNDIQKIKLNETIIQSECLNNQIVLYSTNQNKSYLSLYNYQFELMHKYEFNKQYENIRYCPYFQGIIMYEQKVQYIDKDPNNNYIMQTETQQQTFLQLVDFQTNTYQSNGEQCLQSYLLHGKNKNKISCGFVLDYTISAIQNIRQNRFVATGTHKLKILEIYNNPYEMQQIQEFGILNQQLLTFRNSLPLEDLERINFLKQTDQRILFSHFGKLRDSKLFGFIHSFYGIKWVTIDQDVNIMQLLQKQEIPKIQKVLQEGEDYFYILCNDEEIYKITQNEVKLIYQ